MSEIPYAILQFLVDNPWVVYVWIGATVIAVALRAAYPETEARPRWVKALLAVVDLAQLNLSGPAKLIANKVKADPQP